MRYLPRIVVAASMVGLVGSTFAPGINSGRMEAAAGGPAVSLPSGWYSGDTHVHSQSCERAAALTPLAIYQQQQQEQVNVASVLVWRNSLAMTLQEFQNVAAFVTGQEHPVSQQDPSYVLQFDAEVSGFEASQFGHVEGLHLNNAVFQFSEPYPALILDFFRGQPGAITGYAHTNWSVLPAYPPLRQARPYLAPIDAALGKVDFVESLFAARTNNWTELYYGLLNAGLRIGITAGNDVPCSPRAIGGTRVYARLGAAPLTYSNWTQAIKAGRTCLTDDKHQFLQLNVDGVQEGDERSLAQAGQVNVTATLHVSTSALVNDTLEIVHDGIVVASQSVSLPNGGTHSIPISVNVSSSGWMAARTSVTHTGAVYIIVNLQPICRPGAASYWSGYCDYLSNNITSFRVPGRVQEVRNYIADAKLVFDALNVCASGLPAGVQRYGSSSPACEGPMAIGAGGLPSAGSTFKLTCLGAPSQAAGWLVPSIAASPGLTILGASTLVALGPAAIPVPVSSTAAGYAEFTFQIPANTQGLRFFAQYLWLNTPGCGSGVLSASDAVAVTIQ